MEVISHLNNGLHSDNDPSAQPPNTVRDAFNASLITYGNNRFAYESVKGNVVSFTLPNHASGQRPFTPMGFSSFPDKLIVFSADDSAIKAGEIGKVTFDNQGTGTYLPLYYHNNLGFTKNFPIPPRDGQVAKPENNSIQRVYWTDRNKPMRALNIVDPKLTTYIASGSLSATAGVKYMVLVNGANVSVTYNATVYGPGQAAGNIITTTGGIQVYAGSAYVIEYIPVETLDVVPVHDLGQIEGKIFTSGGGLFCGSYQYAYQLETADGGLTNWSYVTRPFFIAGPKSPGTNSYQYQEYQGGISTVQSSKYLTLTISGIDTNYSKIRVAFIRGTDLAVYDSPKLFTTTGITGASMDISHYGTEVTTTLSTTDLTTANPSLDFVQAISSTKNILFAANVGLDNDIDFDMSGTVTAETFEYLMPSDLAGVVNSATTIAGGYGITGQIKSNDAATGCTFIMPYQWYEVITNCTYNAVAYVTGDYFQGVFGTTAMSVVGLVVAVIRIQKYTSSTTLTAGNYKNIRIENDFVDYKGMIPSHYLQSHWRDEKYRFGILLWNTKGAPLFVKFLKDKTIPSQYATTDPDSGAALGYNPRLIEYDNTTVTNAIRALGVKFSNLDFQLIATELGVALADLDDYISGFSIVRCKRDETIVGQGLLYPTSQGIAPNIYPLSFSRPSEDHYYVTYGRRANVYNWFCPEYIFSFNGRPSVQDGDYLKIQDYYSPVLSGATNGATLDCTGTANYYYKHYIQASPTVASALTTKGSTDNIISQSCVAIGLAAINNTIPGLAAFNVFQNLGQTLAASFIGITTGVGSKTMLVSLVNGEAATNGFGDHVGAGTVAEQTKKPVVNWVRPKTNLYGGTSAEAKAQNQYIWAGHFQPLDAAFMTYMTGTADATPSNPGLLKAAGIVNNVEVFGGDAFITMQDVVRQIRDSSGAGTQSSFAAVFPCETTMNTNFRSGQRHYSKDRFYNATDCPNGILYDSVSVGGRADEVYTYGGHYSNTESQIFYPATPIGLKTQTRDEHLVMFSLLKTDGEIIDSWRRFLPNNQKRVDGQYGKVINIRGKSSRLFYWQEGGIGYLPVQERVSIGAALGDAIQIGVGGTLERFDEMDYYYGNQHQLGLLEGEDFFAWFDFKRRTMLRMTFSGAIDKATMVQGLDSFFSTKFDDVESQALPNIFNSDSPIIGRGIVSYYDSRFKMGFITFKYSKTTASIEKEQDFTIGFSRKLDKYMAFFSFTPGMAVEHGGYLLSSKVIRPIIDNLTAYAVGDELSDGVDFHNYVCILAFTTGAAVQPSLDPTHWIKASQVNQIFVNWRGDICKFYGKVYESYVSVIVKTNGDAMTVDNVEINGNSLRFTDIYTSNSYQTGQDINITSTNPNYKYTDGGWYFSLPLSSTGARLTDGYLQLKMRVKNWTTNVYTSNNLLKSIFSVKSTVRPKK